MPKGIARLTAALGLVYVRFEPTTYIFK